MLEFRLRDYRAEESLASSSLPRVPAHHRHPLSPPPPALSSPSPPPTTAAGVISQVDATEGERVDFYDPLGVHSLGVLEQDTDARSGSETSVISTRKHSDTASQIAAREWTIFKRTVLQKFQIANADTISATSSLFARSKRDNGKSLTGMNLEEPDEQEKDIKDVIKITSPQEYILLLHELKDEIVQAWGADDRITALGLSIKAARLLMDTTALQYYPALFILVTELLDMLGELVFERIKRRAEYADNGTSICALAENFVSGDVCTNAKETCTNWFCKIGSIRELLPRIYLELSILRCWRFLHEHHSHNLHRLTMMMRGIADPIAFSYCNLYMAHCAQSLNQDDIGFLLISMGDISNSVRHIMLGKQAAYNFSVDKKKLLITALEPAIEWIMKCILMSCDQKIDILAYFGLGKGLSKSTDCFMGSSVVLHYLLKELPAETVSSNALEILEHLRKYTDTFLDEYLNYRLFGLRLSEMQLQVDSVNSILDEVLKVITQFDELSKYLLVVDPYVDIVLQYHTDQHLSLILEGISKRAQHRIISGKEAETLQSILLKIIRGLDSLKVLFSMNLFIELRNLLHEDPRDVVNRDILSRVSRRSPIHEPTTIQLLFEVSQEIHSKIDLWSFNHDYLQRKKLISHFVQMVDFGDEMERQLNFFVEGRAALGSSNELKETFVHSSNNLAIKAVKYGKKYVGLIKSCIAFNEVSIPSISSSITQFSLYLETAEIALLVGLISHAIGLIDLSISCFESLYTIAGSCTPPDAQKMSSNICKLCSILVIIPGCLGGSSCFPRTVLSILQSLSWIPLSLKIKALCAVISLSRTLSQKELPYYVNCKEVMGNDLLFFADTSYKKELVSLSDLAIQNIVDTIEKEPHSVMQGKVALEACNCLILSYKASQEASSICSRLIGIAKSSLHPSDKYLQSTVNFYNKHMSEFL